VGNFFQGSCDYHGLTVATTTAMLGPTVKLWQLGCTKHAQVVGQWTPWAARCGFRGPGDPFCGYLAKKVPTFVPLIFVSAYPIQTGDFLCFISSL